MMGSADVACTDQMCLGVCVMKILMEQEKGDSHLSLLAREISATRCGS